MNYGNIKYMDVSNGKGIRTSLYVSGCKNHCKGCFNECTWVFDYGKPFTSEIENTLLESIKNEYISGLSILGGDPCEVENQGAVLHLVLEFRKLFGDSKNIWMWTGYIYDRDLVKGGRRYIEGITDKILNNIDILVDGPFILDKKNLMLKFRGSSNQRLIDVRKTLSIGKVELYAE